MSIWEPKHCRTIAVLTELQLNAVAALAFGNTNANELIAVVGMDENHTITVYNWRSGVTVMKAYTGSQHALGVCFGDDDTTMFTFGVRDVKLWTHIATKSPTFVMPLMGEVGALQAFLCGESFCGKPTLGTSDGFFYIFDQTQLRHTVKAHNGSLNAMHVARESSLLVTGGSDGAVRLWNASHDCIKEMVVDAMTLTPAHHSAVRSVAFSADASHVVVGTRSADILVVSVHDGKADGAKALVESHGVRQLWGLAAHPTKEEFATSGDDQTIRLVHKPRQHFT